MNLLLAISCQHARKCQVGTCVHKDLAFITAVACAGKVAVDSDGVVAELIISTK